MCVAACRYGRCENKISIGTNGVITFGTAHYAYGGSEPIPCGGTSTDCAGGAEGMHLDGIHVIQPNPCHLYPIHPTSPRFVYWWHWGVDGQRHRDNPRRQASALTARSPSTGRTPTPAQRLPWTHLATSGTAPATAASSRSGPSACTGPTRSARTSATPSRPSSTRGAPRSSPRARHQADPCASFRLPPSLPPSLSSPPQL